MNIFQYFLNHELLQDNHVERLYYKTRVLFLKLNNLKFSTTRIRQFFCQIIDSKFFHIKIKLSHIRIKYLKIPEKTQNIDNQKSDRKS